MKFSSKKSKTESQSYTESRQFKAYNIIICLVIIIAIIFFSNIKLMDRIEKIFIDLRFRYTKNINPDPRVVFIDIDESSIKRIGAWPWSREWHATIITTLSKAKAKVILMDIFFSEPTPLVDFFIVEATKLAKNVIYALAFELKKSPIIHLYNKDRLEEIHTVMTKFTIPETQIKGNKKNIPQYAAPIYPLPNLYNAAYDAGHVNITEDIDGNIRQVPTLIKCEDQYYLNLGLAAVAKFLGVKKSDIKIHLGKYIQFKTIEGKIIKIPITNSGVMWINWAGKWHQTFTHYPFWKVIASYQKILKDKQPLINLDEFKGKICLVGLTAMGLIDIKPMPLQNAYPMVGLHANIINTVLQKKFITQPSKISYLIFIIILGLIVGFILPKFRPIGGMLITLIILLGYLVICYFAFKLLGIILNISYPILTILLCYLGITLHSELAGAIERARLYHLAVEDGLTKLYVVRHFKEALEKEISKSSRYNRTLSLIISDIDHFKHVNDTYGHLAGDFILKEVANIFKFSCRESDIIGRYGGEEFVILLPETKREGSVEFAERLRQQVENFTFQYNETKLHITVSFGVAEYIEEESSSEFIKRADEALYVAKETGRNKVCFN